MKKAKVAILEPVNEISWFPSIVSSDFYEVYMSMPGETEFDNV